MSMKINPSEHNQQSNIPTNIVPIEMKQQDKKTIDPVTGLPNLLYLESNFDLAVQELEYLCLTYQHDFMLPFFLLKIDSNKQMKANLSPEVYQALQVSVAQRIQEALGRLGKLVILSNGEFAIQLVPIEDRIKINNLADEVIQLCSEPFTALQQQILLSLRIGISLYKRDGYSLSELIQKAHYALEFLSESSPYRYRFYSSTFGLVTEMKAFLENELHYAIARDQLQVVYHPQINLKTGKTHGVEALVRWQHPELGFVSPLDFIPIAETTGLIHEIGLWVFQTAVQEIRQIQDKYQSNLRLAINFSSTQLHVRKIDVDIIRILHEGGFDPTLFDVEIKESVIANNFGSIRSQLLALQKVGCKIALDDFGVGYSSLNYLRFFSWDILKIDRCFIGGIEESTVNQTITQGIITIAQELGCQVFAEGIETKAERSLLEQYGCDFAQGYYWGKPISVDLLEEAFLNSISHNQVGNA